MLENKVIIYDDSCPLCKVYTHWFVAWRFLKPENRIGFATAPSDVTDHVDLVRGRHEIPLFDRETKETLYGLDALTYVLGSKWTWLNPLFQSRFFKWMSYPLYQIITYNRRVIAGCKACCGFDCAPDLNRFYRTFYLLLALTLVVSIAIGLTLNAPVTVQLGNLPVVAIAAFAIAGLLCGTIVRLSGGRETGWNYAGNYVTTLLIVALAMTPMLIFSQMPKTFVSFNLLMAGLLGLAELRRREI